MRIVGGKYRGKKLWTPEGKDVRPTSERAREAIFNILYSKLGGDYGVLNIADIFCGTGAFGFEALSRGFKYVTLADIDTIPVQKNAKLFAAEKDRFEVLRVDATRLPRARRKYDLVFMDAPYAMGLTELALEQIIRQAWLGDGAICIAEVRKDERFLPPEELELLDERVYGLARVLFLRRK
ncbi:MAG: RsmD family RNA methyltransferase [Alphaproteobacteria bacterium]|nr:RsmD family RNA methyltransferase [Alphaproteobacteria bacterium]MBR1757026.1 RsmD family RNA methyltransferase [Alphaproteobacteria bacterium]